MWNKRKEDEYPPKSNAAPVPASATGVQSERPVATPPALAFHAPERGMAVIGKSVMIKGQILSREDLTIDGEVEGSVELQENRLTVGPHGKVQAGVKAREVVVLGTITGNVETSDKIEIRKDARLVGDIKTARVVIEDGAYFKGSIDIIRPTAAPAPTPAPHTAAKPASATVPAAAAAAAPASASNDPRR